MVEVTTKLIFGSEAAVQARFAASTVSQTINTSFVERNNLTCRQCNGRLARKVLSFSKELTWLEKHLWLSLAYYHFVLAHDSLSQRLSEPQPTRGSGSPKRWQPITPAMAAGVRNAATANGLVMMMHTNSFEAQQFAVNAGVDVIAHGMWNWGAPDKQRTSARGQALLDRIVQKRTGYQATIQVMGGLRAYFDPEYLKMPEIPRIIPAPLLAWFNSPEGKWFKKEN